MKIFINYKDKGITGVIEFQFSNQGHRVVCWQVMTIIKMKIININIK